MVNFNPHLPNISRIIKSYSHFIYDSPTLAQIFPKGSTIPSHRRAKNIKELLAEPKRPNYSNNDHSATGCFKCRKKCDLYKNHFKKDKIFYSTRTHRYYTIRQHLDYKSKNVIYLANCKKCRVQYVGSTSNEFKVRFQNHKSATTLIGVYLQGKLSGAPSCVLSIPTALIKDQNLTQKIELGSVNSV